MSKPTLTGRLESLIFDRRPLVIDLFALATVFMVWWASGLRIDAGFFKLLPLAHPYMSTFLKSPVFMIMDPAVGNTMNGDAAYTMAGSDFALLTSNQVAGADLTGKKGWSRALEPGEKVTGSATLFFGVLRFGTYAPLGQSVSCAPLGEGRLNEISGDYGQLRDVTGNGVISAGERYYTSYLSHGYVSSGQAIIIGNAVYHVVVQSGVPRLQRNATLGVPSRIFWYMQPER